VATWLRFDTPPRLADGAIDPLGVLTLADRMPGCVAERLGHQGPQDRSGRARGQVGLDVPTSPLS
jgi:hypothetical protein